MIWLMALKQSGMRHMTGACAKSSVSPLSEAEMRYYTGDTKPAEVPDFGAACDGDADRNMILGAHLRRSRLCRELAVCLLQSTAGNIIGHPVAVRNVLPAASHSKCCQGYLQSPCSLQATAFWCCNATVWRQHDRSAESSNSPCMY